jgi:hypothetical protein
MLDGGDILRDGSQPPQAWVRQLYSPPNPSKTQRVLEPLPPFPGQP